MLIYLFSTQEVQVMNPFKPSLTCLYFIIFLPLCLMLFMHFLCSLLGQHLDLNYYYLFISICYARSQHRSSVPSSNFFLLSGGVIDTWRGHRHQKHPHPKIEQPSPAIYNIDNHPWLSTGILCQNLSLRFLCRVSLIFFDMSSIFEKYQN